MRNEVERSADRLDKERVRLGTKVEQIVREQEAVVEAANRGIERLNSDLRALRRRLDPYVDKNPRRRDERYSDLKNQYEAKLQERATLENARSLAEESISAARLHRIPGEYDRQENV